MLHHHHLARDEGAVFVLVASLITAEQAISRQPARCPCREASTVAKELAYWFSFLQSIRPTHDAVYQPFEMCVVLTHRDRCNAFDEAAFTARLRTELHRIAPEWPAAAPIWCINSLDPSACVAVHSWLRERHTSITGSSGCIPRICSAMEKPLHILRQRKTDKVCKHKHRNVGLADCADFAECYSAAPLKSCWRQRGSMWRS